MTDAPYDKIAEEYYDEAHKTSRNFDHTTRVALEALKNQIPDEGMVLDVGAGRGRCNEFLGIDPKRVVQLDNSPAMLNVQPREDCLLRIVHDATDLPFLDGEFACVTAFLCDPFLGLSFLYEVYRVLTVGGLFIATTPSHKWGTALRAELKIDQSQTRFVRYRAKEEKDKKVIVPSVLIPKIQVQEMLEHVGFREERFEVTVHCLLSNAEPISDHIVLPANILRCDKHTLGILYSIVARK